MLVAVVGVVAMVSLKIYPWTKKNDLQVPPLVATRTAWNAHPVNGSTGQMPLARKRHKIIQFLPPNMRAQRKRNASGHIPATTDSVHNVTNHANEISNR